MSAWVAVAPPMVGGEYLDEHVLAGLWEVLHLAENKGNEDALFAFLATYSHRLSTQGKVQYLPLGKALQEYAGEKSRAQLLQLPVQKGSKNSQFLKALADSGEIYHPLAWTPGEAFAFLKEIPIFEASGIIVRVPNWWKAKKPPRPQVSVTVGGKKSSVLGIQSMLEFSVVSFRLQSIFR